MRQFVLFGSQGDPGLEKEVAGQFGEEGDDVVEEAGHGASILEPGKLSVGDVVADEESFGALRGQWMARRGQGWGGRLGGVLRNAFWIKRRRDCGDEKVEIVAVEIIETMEMIEIIEIIV